MLGSDYGNTNDVKWSFSKLLPQSTLLGINPTIFMRYLKLNCENADCKGGIRTIRTKINHGINCEWQGPSKQQVEFLQKLNLKENCEHYVRA